MKVLIIGIHIDDCEMMAATASLLVKRGAEVTILNIKHYMHYKGGSPEADEQCMRASALIGAKKIILDYNIDKYYRNNEQSVRDVEAVIRDVKPDIIFMMHPVDNHIEHVECAKTTREAIFAAAVDGIVPNEIYSYECGPKQTMCYFEPDVYVDIEETIEDLYSVVRVFCTEHANGDHLANEMRISREFRGQECGLKFADGFKIIKYPNGSNDFLLRQLLEDKFRWAGKPMYYIGSKYFL